jgi:hypothetical protein
MSFRVEIPSVVQRRIVSWSLPDFVFVEVHLRLTEDLANDPKRFLIRTRQPFDGMAFFFELIDPSNRLCVHRFVFQIVYSQDEERILVARGAYARYVGM